jgi:hypothetical protein
MQTYKVIRKIICKYPGAAEVTNNMTLHYACLNNKPCIATMQMLVELYPESKEIPNTFGNLPWDYEKAKDEAGSNVSKAMLHLLYPKNMPLATNCYIKNIKGI